MSVDYNPEDFEIVTTSTLLELANAREVAYEEYHSANTQVAMLAYRSDLPFSVVEKAEERRDDLHTIHVVAKKRVAMKKFADDVVDKLVDV